MRRDFKKLRNGPFDLLVIGGGVLGAWTAYDGALRGLKTAIVDKGDWAGETSSASSKLIHGGLRYLEHLWFGLVYETLKEREKLISLAPHRVFQLPFLLPVYEDARVGRLSLKTGLAAYDLLAKINSKKPFPSHRYLTKNEFLREAPYLRKEGLTGGFLYTDARTDDARFTLEIIDGAVQAGAVAVNYAEAREILVSENRALGAVIVDNESNDRVDLRASVTVNAAGPRAFSLGNLDRNVLPNFTLTKGVHLVLPEVSPKNALLFSTRKDNRIFFMLPWYGSTLLGTTDTEFYGNPGNLEVEPGDISYLLEAGNSYLENIRWEASQIQGQFAGLRVLKKKHGKTPSDRTREWELVEPIHSLLMAVGGKFTSARAEAEKINDRALGILGIQGGKHPTENRPFPWAPAEERDWQRPLTDAGIKAVLDLETAKLCAFRYGKLLPELLEIISDSNKLSERIDPKHPFCAGEIVYALKYEMARNLKDLFFRRIPLTKIAKMEKEVIERGARIAAGVLGWDKERVSFEVNSVLKDSLF
ncbi:MAG: glycerol-3-phosphate dehydrogenase/oxidase [Nitrospinota bacterium]